MFIESSGYLSKSQFFLLQHALLCHFPSPKAQQGDAIYENTNNEYYTQQTNFAGKKKKLLDMINSDSCSPKI